MMMMIMILITMMMIIKDEQNHWHEHVMEIYFECNGYKRGENDIILLLYFRGSHESRL